MDPYVRACATYKSDYRSLVFYDADSSNISSCMGGIRGIIYRQKMIAIDGVDWRSGPSMKPGGPMYITYINVHCTYYF
jgi:hypothetical protein